MCVKIFFIYIHIHIKNTRVFRDAPQSFGKSAIFGSLKIDGGGRSSRILGKVKLKIANIKESGISMS